MRLMVALLPVLFFGCTSVSEERIGVAEQLHWIEGSENPEKVEHYPPNYGPDYQYEEVVKIWGSVAPIYGHSGFLKIVKKRAAKWGCNAVLEMNRGTQSNTTQYTYIGRRTAFSFPVTTHVPYGTFIGIRKFGWRPLTQGEYELKKQIEQRGNDQ